MLILSAVGCITPPRKEFTTTTIDSNAYVSKCSSMDLNLRDSCYSNAALELQKPSICASVLTESRRNSCYSNVAVAKNNTSICDEITDELSRNYCYGQVGSK